jgi:hypothetical protein
MANARRAWCGDGIVAELVDAHDRDRVRAAGGGLIVLLAMLAGMTGGTAVAEDLPALAALHRVNVSVDLAHPLESTTADDLVAHLAGALRRAEPPITVGDSATDRIRLTVFVRPMSATTLRGFWLPFSGTYGIGTLRLGVERVVTLPGASRAFPAVVWQTERAVGGPWRVTHRDIARLLDDIVADLLKARRQAG